MQPPAHSRSGHSANRGRALVLAGGAYMLAVDSLVRDSI